MDKACFWGVKELLESLDIILSTYKILNTIFLNDILSR
jgi:hypothetical protein